MKWRKLSVLFRAGFRMLNSDIWSESICNSTYFELLLNVSVPTMTSNTKPSGEVFADTDEGSYLAINAFNDNDAEKNIWMTQNLTSGYIGYDFKKNVIVKLVLLRNRNSIYNIFPVKTFKIQGSNGDEWEVLSGK